MGATKLDARPPGINVLYRPGTVVILVLNWPAGSLAGRTFRSSLQNVDLPIVITGDSMTITVEDEVTGPLNAHSVLWRLEESVGGDFMPVIIGTWQPSYEAKTGSLHTVEVTLGGIQVEVTVQGAGPSQAQFDALAAATPVLKVWDGSAYVWPGADVAPSGFTNILFSGPDDPTTAPGGRNVAGDIWIDTAP